MRESGRNIKAFLISPELFLGLFATGTTHPQTRVVDGIPDGARLLHIGLDSGRTIRAVVEHESFPLVDDGVEIPTGDPPLVTAYYCDCKPWDDK